MITGGSSGIGKAAALRLAEAGARVAVLGTNEEALNVTCAEIRGRQGDGASLAVVADIRRPDEVRAAVDSTVKHFGRLDIVFANAGINGVWAPIEKLQPEEWETTIDTNLTGTFLTIKFAVGALRRRGGSVIINSSVNGTRMFSNTGATAYACSKAGQVALAKMLALELAEDRIRVNAICPGAIDTPIQEKTEERGVEDAREPVEFPEGQIPLTDGKPGTPEQVADLVLFLASAASSHITGAVVFIDGGQSLLQG